MTEPHLSIQTKIQVIPLPVLVNVIYVRRIVFSGARSEGFAGAGETVLAQNPHHHISIWQGKSPQVMVFFDLKNPQFRIVKTDGFLYLFCIRCRTKFYPELHYNYVEYF